MTQTEVEQLFLAKPGAGLDFPFDNTTCVYKVNQKIFGLMFTRDEQLSINLKCKPELALQLRDVFEEVKPGYHMNKGHWNTVLINGALPTSEIARMIEHSYALVVKSLKKADRNALELAHADYDIYRGLVY